MAKNNDQSNVYSFQVKEVNNLLDQFQQRKLNKVITPEEAKVDNAIESLAGLDPVKHGEFYKAAENNPTLSVDSAGTFSRPQTIISSSDSISLSDFNLDSKEIRQIFDSNKVKVKLHIENVDGTLIDVLDEVKKKNSGKITYDNVIKSLTEDYGLSKFNAQYTLAAIDENAIAQPANKFKISALNSTGKFPNTTDDSSLTLKLKSGGYDVQLLSHGKMDFGNNDIVDINISVPLKQKFDVYPEITCSVTSRGEHGSKLVDYLKVLDSNHVKLEKIVETTLEKINSLTKNNEPISLAQRKDLIKETSQQLSKLTTQSAANIDRLSKDLVDTTLKMNETKHPKKNIISKVTQAIKDKISNYKKISYTKDISSSPDQVKETAKIIGVKIADINNKPRNKKPEKPQTKSNQR